MRKLIISVAAMAAMMLAGCQQEMLEPASETNIVSYSVEIPEVATKATVVDDGSNINDLVYAVYRTTANEFKDVTADNMSLVYQRNPNDPTKFVDGKTVVRLELVNNQNYVVLFWAQVSDAWVVGQNFDLTNVTYPVDEEGNMDANNNGLAAFAGVDFLNKDNKPGTRDVTLYRPFAQINVGTITDIKVGVNPETTYTVKLDKSAFRVKGAKTSFNVLTQNAEGEGNLTFKAKAVPEGTLSVNNITYTYAAMNYVFANEKEGNVNVEFDLYTKQHGDVMEIKVPAVPVAKNYRTNIVGNLLTSSTDYTVTLHQGWYEPAKEVVVVQDAAGLQDAINNAEGNTEIKLGGDVDLNDFASLLSTFATKASHPSAGIVIPEGKTIVLNLNNCTVSQTLACEDSYSMIDNNGNLTVTGGGSLVFKNNSEGGGSAWGTYTINNKGTLTIDGATVSHLGSTGDVAVNRPTDIAIQNYAGKVTVNAGIISSQYFRSLRDFTAGGEIVINGGTFNGQVWMQGLGNGSSSLTVNGGEFAPISGYDSSSLYITNGTNVVNVSIKGGTFSTKIGAAVADKEGVAGCITGGKFTTDAKDNTNNALFSDDYNLVQSENDYWTLEAKPAVAKIGETTYTSLQKAVAAAQKGDTITLIDDIEQVDGVIVTDKNITIDLNDKTFTVSEGASTNNRNFKINGSSVVTIKNGIMVAAGEYAKGAYGTVSTEGTANVTLEDVKLYNYRGNGLNVKAYSGTTVTINNTEIYSEYGGGVEAAGGNVVLNNVKVDQKGMYTAPYNSMAISVNGKGVVTVNSGEYKTECITAEEANNQGTSHGPWCAGVLNSGGTLIINGGTFSNDNFGENSLATYARGLLLADTGANIEINGGNFNAVQKIIDIQNNLGDASKNPKATLKGGTYSSNPLTWEGLISAPYGYKVKEVDGLWTVVFTPVAKIGETGYATLIDAVEAVKDGETIILVANEVFTENNRCDNGGWWDGLAYSGDKSFTIDLGGHTISQNGALDDYLIWIKNDGEKANTITFKNGTMDAGTSAYSALATASSNAQEMTVNLENINLVNNNSTGAVVKARGGSVLNVNAGTVITGKDSYVGIEAVGNNTIVNVSDGAEIYQNGTSSYVGAIIGASYNATLNIYGGEGKSAKCGIIVMSTGATINVSGGEWTANGDGTVAAGNNGVLVSQNNRYESGWTCKSVLNVTGGTFKGGYDCWGMGPGQEPDDAQINIKGGNFNADPRQYVVAGYEATENAGIYTVDKPAALKDLEAALANGGNVTLANDVTLLESIKVENKVVLDLNGKTITAPLFSAFEVKTGGELTVKNGKVVAYESTVRAIGGKVIIESGEYTSTGTALDSPATYRYSLDCREGGELIINGGTFKSNNGMINVGSTVTINGGKFENIVEKSMTRHFAYVSAPLTINDGEFYGKANSSADGCFFCGAAAGGDIQVNGGKFTSLWTSGSVNRIFEVYFGGTINVTGGMFNTNGGIATFVTDNTDDATKAAYPYVAK